MVDVKETIIPQGEVFERLGFRTLTPFVVPSKAPRVNLRRVKFNGGTYINRADLFRLMKMESEALGGDTVLDRLREAIREVTA